MKLIKTNSSGVYYVENKKGVSYYYSFRDIETKKVKRKKLFNRDKHLAKYVKECILEIERIKSEPQEEIESKKINIEDIKNSDEYKEELKKANYSLEDLKEIYFNSRLQDKEKELRQHFQININKDLKETNFLNIINKTLDNIEKKRSQFDKHFAKYKYLKTPNKILDREHREEMEKLIANLDLAPKTRKDMESLVKTVFSYAIKNDIILRNDNPFFKMNTKIIKRNRERVLSYEELKILLDECKKFSKNHTYMKNGKEVQTRGNINIYLFIYLCVLTGARASTILMIKKSDIDIYNKTITLINTKVRMRKYKVMLNDESVEWFKNKVLPFRKHNECIVKSLTNQERDIVQMQPIAKPPKILYEIFDYLFNDEIDKSNNLERDKVANIHSIRRSIGTLMVKEGELIYNVSKFLDHSSIQQTEEYLNLEVSNEKHNIVMSKIF